MTYLHAQGNYLRRTLHIICISMSFFIFSACGVSGENNINDDTNAVAPANQSVSDKPHANVQKAQKHMTIIGVLRYQNIEGGFYGFIAHDGQKYMLSGLDDEFKKNGIELELEVSEIEGRITFQQFGKSVKVHNVKVIDTSKIENKLNIM